MRKRYEARFKAKLALEAVKQEKTVAQLSAKHGVNVVDLTSRLVAWMKGFPPDLAVPRIFPARTNRLDGFNKNIMQFCN